MELIVFADCSHSTQNIFKPKPHLSWKLPKQFLLLLSDYLWLHQSSLNQMRINCTILYWGSHLYFQYQISNNLFSFLLNYTTLVLKTYTRKRNRIRNTKTLSRKMTGKLNNLCYFIIGILYYLYHIMIGILNYMPYIWAIKLNLHGQVYLFRLKKLDT